MENNAKELLARGDRRFGARLQLDSFRQEVALAFAPWLASWTSELVMGADFAGHLVDGTPLLTARDFVGQIGAMTRPPGKQYFWHRTNSDDINNDNRARTYLDWRSSQMMRVMSNRTTGFTRATKQADEFFGLFGDAVLSIDVNAKMTDLRVRCWHTKDCVWVIGDENTADTITRKEPMTARIMVQRFGKKNCHSKVLEALDKEPDKTFNVRHEVLPAADYEVIQPRWAKNQKFVSVWIDADNGKVLREVPQETFRYVVPRWVTVPGWSYAISPAATIALPDARLLQQQASAILDAAEKTLSPPVIAYSDTVRGAMSLQSNHVNWVDKNFDSGSRPPIQPLELGKNFALGVESLLRTEQQLSRAFYLDVLRMPDTRRSKSKEEVSFLIDEYVRAALPLFAPIQSDYIDPLLFEIDTVLDGLGVYDRPKPRMLEDMELVFAWDNPLSDMLERKKMQVIAETGQLANAIAALEAAAQQSPSLQQIDTIKMTRDGMMSAGAGAWLKDEQSSEEAMTGQAQAGAMQSAIAAAPGLAKLIDSGVGAAQAASEIPIAAEPSYPMLPMPA